MKEKRKRDFSTKLETNLIHQTIGLEGVKYLLANSIIARDRANPSLQDFYIRKGCTFCFPG